MMASILTTYWEGLIKTKNRKKSLLGLSKNKQITSCPRNASSKAPPIFCHIFVMLLKAE